jgi:hypothetical protein
LSTLHTRMEIIDTGGAGIHRDLKDEIEVEMSQENLAAQDGGGRLQNLNLSSFSILNGFQQSMVSKFSIGNAYGS